MPFSFVMTGGGTGGHVFPALAVAEVLRRRGHRLLYIGRKEGIEARLVPPSGIPMEFVEAGALNRVGFRQRFSTTLKLPAGVWQARRILRQFRADAVFSLGGFVAGPVMAAAFLNRSPLVIMEPNAFPGFANRLAAPYAHRALLGFEATRRGFSPQTRSEVTGVPVRAAFFAVPPKQDGPFTVLITGGSGGANRLNKAAAASWPLFRSSQSPVRLILQTGASGYPEAAREFAQTGLPGEVVPFIPDMPAAFAAADLVICRAGAGAVSEVAAAGMPAVLVPFPFAADDHQRKNAAALVNAGAARMILDGDFTGELLFRTVEELRGAPAILDRMRKDVRPFARPDSAECAAQVLENAALSRK